MDVIVAEGALLESILDLTFPIWHEGLSRASYSKWNAAQLRTAFGGARLQRYALVDSGGRVVASAKRYRFDACVDGRVVPFVGIGAVFTPPALRGRGYASRLIERLLDGERQAGAVAAGLFSEIGASFYERLGFQTVALDECTIHVSRKDGAPAMLVRAGHDSDLPAIAAMHDTRSAPARFSLRRDVPLVHYALTKKRLLAGLGPPGLRRVEFFVAEEGATAVAYVVLSVNDTGWTLEEAGDRDPAGARLGAMLQVLVAREPSHAVPLIRTWWPAAFAVPPQLTLTDRTIPRELFMVRTLAGDPVPTSAADVFYWHSDAF